MQKKTSKIFLRLTLCMSLLLIHHSAFAKKPKNFTTYESLETQKTSRELAEPGKMTIVEYYVDWCETCKLMPDYYKTWLQHQPDTAIKRVHLPRDFDFASAMLLALRGTIPLEICPPQQGVTWSADLRLREVSAYRLSEAQAQQLIESVKAPTLALMAKQGIELMQQSKQRWSSHYPQLQLVELEGGHHLHMTHASACASEIRRFLLEKQA